MVGHRVLEPKQCENDLSAGREAVQHELLWPDCELGR